MLISFVKQFELFDIKNKDLFQNVVLFSKSSEWFGIIHPSKGVLKIYIFYR